MSFELDLLPDIWRGTLAKKRRRQRRGGKLPTVSRSCLPNPAPRRYLFVAFLFFPVPYVHTSSSLPSQVPLVAPCATLCLSQLIHFRNSLLEFFVLAFLV
jgi:hypothetical protein